MTMPSKIWANTNINFCDYCERESVGYESYIRADIADELARALDMAIENAEEDSAYVWSEVIRIRDKYRAMMEK